MDMFSIKINKNTPELLFLLLSDITKNMEIN